MRIFLFYEIAKSPAGGGNQFLGILSKVFASKGVLSPSLADADVILFNSHHSIGKLAIAKYRHPEKVFAHRIDGPMRLYNSPVDIRDHMVNLAATMISDGTIFQSGWSRKENYRLGLFKNNFDAVIHNSVDPDIFNRKRKEPFSTNRKVRLIATSWSTNPRKGFDVYEWLDKNLDFSRFEMTFVGNSPIRFRNIKHIGPLSSRDLAEVMKRQDIYIFGSKVEACSNALIEALHCGLPSVAYNFSSNPEIIGDGGDLFDKSEDIPDILNRIIANYSDYQNSISLRPIKDIANEYEDFMKEIFDSALKGNYIPKSLSRIDMVKLLFRLFALKLNGRIFSIRSKNRSKLF